MRKCLLLSAALWVLAAWAARAEDEVQRLEQETSLVNARAALQTAQTAEVQARMSALGLTSNATGKTELKARGGELEGFMLASGTLAQAAGTIAAAVNDARKGKAVLVLDGDQAFDLRTVASVKMELSNLASQADAAAALCGEGRSPEIVAALALPAIVPIIGAVLGALKTDTEINGFEGPATARPLVNAIAVTRGDWILPGERMPATVGESEIATGWAALQEKQTALARCRATPKKLDAAGTAQVDRAIAAIEAFQSRAAVTGAGPSVLAQAIQLDALARDKPLLLRLFVEKSGGSLLLRKNLWTALGAPAVGITGGAVVSWRLADPDLGKVVAGGVVVCRTALTSMRTIQNGTVRPSVCQPATVAAPNQKRGA